MAIITVLGKVITAQQIAGFKTSAASQAANLSIWANACAVQTYDGNNNWANDLFALPTMRLQSGKLSVQGKNVLAYIKAFAPRFNFNTTKGAVSMTGKDKTDGKLFTMPATKVPLVDDKGEPTTDFNMTFVEFLNWSKPKVEPKSPAIKCGTLEKALEKVTGAIVEHKLVGSGEEVAALALQLRAAFAIVEALSVKLNGAAIPVDMVLANQLLASGQNGKSKRAGGKVEAGAL